MDSAGNTKLYIIVYKIVQPNICICLYVIPKIKFIYLSTYLPVHMFI